MHVWYQLTRNFAGFAELEPLDPHCPEAVLMDLVSNQVSGGEMLKPFVIQPQHRHVLIHLSTWGRNSPHVSIKLFMLQHLVLLSLSLVE